MNLIEKKQKMAALIKDARAKLDAGDMDAYNKMDAEIDKLEAEIKAEEKQQAREDALNQIPEPAKSKAQPEDKTPKQKITATDEYKSAFFHALRGGKSSLTSEERKLLENVMSTGSDSGGMLVMPEEMENSVRALLEKQVVMRRLASTLTLTADRKIVLASSYGAAEWIGENGAYPKVDDKYDTVTIGSHKLGKIIQVSEELLHDSEFDLTGLISTSFARSFAEGEESAFLTGDGVGKPKGVLVDAEVGVTTAASSAVTADELLDLFYSLKPGYRQKATFLMSDSMEKVIRKLKNATTGDYMWQPGLTASQPNTLLGRPVAVSDYMPTVEAGAKAIAFGDFSQYIIKDTLGMQMQVLDQLYAENGQVGFKGNERTDGRLIVKEAVKVLQMKAGES
jgi:HK97 family phage major capsid protein